MNHILSMGFPYIIVFLLPPHRAQLAPAPKAPAVLIGITESLPILQQAPWDMRPIDEVKNRNKEVMPMTFLGKPMVSHGL